MSTENQNQEQQNQDQGKVQKQYDANLQQLLLILNSQPNGTTLLKRKKAGADLVTDVVGLLLKESNESFQEEIKGDIKGLIQAKIALDDEITKKEKELVKSKEDSMKKFNEAANKVFGKINGQQELAERYKKSLTTVVSAGTEGQNTNGNV